MRLTLIIDAFALAFNYINLNYNQKYQNVNNVAGQQVFERLQIDHPIFKSFEDNFRSKIKESPVIEVKRDSIASANKLLQFFIKTKLIIAGYKVSNWLNDFFDLISQLKISFSTNYLISTRNEINETRSDEKTILRKLMCFILKYKGKNESLVTG